MESWIDLENEIGYDKARLVAFAVLYSIKPNNWKFFSWLKYLNYFDRKTVEKYFDSFLTLETNKMRQSGLRDMPHLKKRYKLN